MRRSSLRFIFTLCAILGAFSSTASAARAQDSRPSQDPATSKTDAASADDAVPAMLTHPETDRWWISGQANLVSQYHVVVAGPRDGRQYTRFCAREQSRRRLSQPFVQHIPEPARQDANRAHARLVAIVFWRSLSPEFHSQ